MRTFTKICFILQLTIFPDVLCLIKHYQQIEYDRYVTISDFAHVCKIAKSLNFK